MPIIPVRGLGSVGIVQDTSPVLLPTQGWSDGMNVRFNNGSVEKITGHTSVFTATVEPQFLQYWPRPTTQYYIYGNAQTVRRVDAAGQQASIVPSDVTFNANGVWHSSLFNGGYTVVFNNTEDAPQYITFGNGGNVEFTTMQPLPDWPTSFTAGVVRPFKNALIAGDLEDSSGDVVAFMPGSIRVSSQAAPGKVPASWTVGASLLTTADEFELSQSEPVYEIVDLRGTCLIFTGSSIHSLQLAQNRNPTVVNNLNYDYGTLATGCAVVFQNKVLSVDKNDIYLTNGTGSIESIADAKTREYFYGNLNQTNYESTFIIQNTPQDEMWICYPTVDNTENFCDEALIWNYRDNTWSKRDLPNTLGATLGPLSDNTNFLPASDYVHITGFQTNNAGDSDRIHAVDQPDTYTFNGVNYTSFVERKNLDMGELDSFKWSGSVYPLMSGTGSVDVSVDGNNIAGNLTTFPVDRAMPFSIEDDYKVDPRSNGRFFNIRFEENSNTAWKLDGYSITVDKSGTR